MSAGNMTVLPRLLKIDELIRRRIIPLEGITNFRDMGYLPIKKKDLPSKESVLRPAVVYRSCDLAKISKKDAVYLESLDIKSIIDLREPDCRDKNPDKTIGSVKNRYYFPIDCTIIVDEKKMNSGKEKEAMIGFYTGMIEKFTPQFKDFFSVLLESENLPLVFHCASGKDRTGLAAALFLLALGVPRNIINADYVLTVERLKIDPNTGRRKENVSDVDPVLNITPFYLDCAMKVIDKLFGGLDRYLTSELKVDRNKLFDIYKS
jgi:protein-tyrosine phosphatase